MRGLTIGGDWRQFGVVAGESATIESNIIEDPTTRTDLYGVTVSIVGEDVTFTNNEIALSDDHISSISRSNYVAGVQVYGTSSTVTNNDIVATGADDDNLPATGVEIGDGYSPEEFEDNNFMSDINTKTLYVNDLSGLSEDILNNNEFDRAALQTGDSVSKRQISNSIDLAVSEANSGETIEVETGTYEGFTIEKDVDILGPNSENVGKDHDEGSEAKIGGTVKINDLGAEEEVALKGFTIESDEEASVVDINGLEDDTRTVTVSNNIIDGEDSNNAVTLNSDGDITIEGNEIENVVNGVFLRDDASDSGADVNVENNRIEGADGFSPGDNWADGAAIKVVEKGTNLDIEASDFTGNTIRDSDLGFWLENHTESGSQVRENPEGLISEILEQNQNDFGQAVTVEDDHKNMKTAVFSSIQDAVDMAEDGATVEVREGTYNESVMVETDGLTIEGSGMDSTTINATAEGEGNAAIKVPTQFNLNGLTVGGFTLQSNSGAGAVAVKDTQDIAQDLNISYNRIVHKGDSADGNNAVQILSEVGADESDYGLLMKENEIEAEGAAVLLNGNANGQNVEGTDKIHQDVRFEGNTIAETGSEGGMSLGDVQDLEVVGNEFQDGVKTFGTALVVASDVEVRGNTFNGAGVLVTDLQNADMAEMNNVDVTRNSFVSDVGINVDNDGADALVDGEVVNAEHNYWGQEKGPSSDQVSSKVDFRPWLMETPIENDPEIYERTIALGDGWSILSSPGDVGVAEFRDSSGEIDNPVSYTYNTSGENWEEMDVTEMNPLQPVFVDPDVRAVGMNISESESPSVQLNEGWNLVGATQNEGNQQVGDVFSDLTEISSIVAPEDYNAKEYKSTSIADGAKKSIESVSDQETSAYDGYWLNAASSDILSLPPAISGAEG